MDHEVVRAAQQGDVAAMNRLLSELSPYVGRVCRAIAGDNGEDAMQETLISILRNLPSLREPAALHGWVRRIAVRHAVRLAQPDTGGPLEDGRWLAEPTPDLDSVIDVERLLASLQPEQRAMLVLRDLDGLSEQEVAALLDIPVGTAKSRLSRARQAARQRLGGGRDE